MTGRMLRATPRRVSLSPVTRLYTRRPVLAWAFYDWANSAFATTVMAGFFPAFFQRFWSVGVDPTISTSRLGFANGLAGFVVAVLAPALGAIADRCGRRKRFLIAWSLLGIVGTGLLWFVERGEWAWAATLFVVGSVGFSAANVFYDALLLDVARDDELDRVSAFGYALGYLGGGLLFALNVWMTLQPPRFGLADAAEAIRASFVLVALWWLVFMLPLALRVRERPGEVGVSLASATVQGLQGLLVSLRRVAHYRELALFLVAYWLYIDAVNTIIKMAVDYGTALGLPTESLLAALLMTQFIAFPAALVFGWLGDRIGARRGILIGIAIYTLATLYAFFLDSVVEFFVLAGMVGLVQGGVQSLSRSFFGSLVPEGKGGEFFGFYNMMGKFATVLGPMLVALVALITGSSRASIASLAILFLAGGLVLLLVREPSDTSRRGSSLG
ncbi:MAG: MFS transporter [Sinobacteraceae bacterium]|nr:MFS transporter [Nevskiaceae bacterium]MCP5359545.1 MFS transporter [Nevskiaceae bacterium]MCP5467494.1 MFS transporter [Nevskiaceae bacterium]